MALILKICLAISEESIYENTCAIASGDYSTPVSRRRLIKDGNKNRLRDIDVHRIVDVFNTRLEVAKYSRMVGVDEIEKNEFNLNIPRYINRAGKR